MREVVVAWPDDDATAEVIASRLRAAGITCRVDRALWGTYQVPAPSSQVTVLVADRDARRARAILDGTAPAAASRAARNAALMPAVIGVLAIAGLVFALVVVLTLVPR